MRKTVITALGAGLLAIAALQFPHTLLAKSPNLQLESTSGRAEVVPIASRQGAPSGTRRPAGIITNSKAWRPGATKSPRRFGPSSNCHPPTVIHSTKTLVSALPEPKVCFGKIVHWHKLTYCLHCGGFPPNYGSSCAVCKPDYSYNAGSKLCCK